MEGVVPERLGLLGVELADLEGVERLIQVADQALVYARAVLSPRHNHPIPRWVELVVVALLRRRLGHHPHRRRRPLNRGRAPHLAAVFLEVVQHHHRHLRKLRQDRQLQLVDRIGHRTRVLVHPGVAVTRSQRVDDHQPGTQPLDPLPQPGHLRPHKAKVPRQPPLGVVAVALLVTPDQARLHQRFPEVLKPGI